MELYDDGGILVLKEYSEEYGVVLGKKKKHFQNNDRGDPCTRWVQYIVGCGLRDYRGWFLMILPTWMR